MSDRHSKHFAAPIGVDPDGDDHRHRDNVMIASDFDVGRVEPDIRPLALDRPCQECLHPLVDLAAQAGHLALADALHAEGFDQVIDRSSGDALYVGLLDDNGQGLLRHSPRLQEGREVATAAQLWDARFDRASPRLPVAVAVTVALVAPGLAALAMPGTAEPLGLQLHQAFGGKADHLAQECPVRALFQQPTKGDLILGHRGGPLGSGCRSRQPNPTQDHRGGR